jgi:hypothetical protein
MKYKKFTHKAITPLWVRMGVWFSALVTFTILGLFFYAAIVEIIESYMAQYYNDISFQYRTDRPVMAIFIAVSLFFTLLPISIPFLAFALNYLAKFKRGNFKLSNIRNPEKYDPDDIRKYFPEYRSKKEKMEDNSKNEQINQKEQ